MRGGPAGRRGLLCSLLTWLFLDGRLALAQLDLGLGLNPNDQRVLTNRKLVLASHPELAQAAVQLDGGRRAEMLPSAHSMPTIKESVKELPSTDSETAAAEGKESLAPEPGTDVGRKTASSLSVILAFQLGGIPAVPSVPSVPIVRLSKIDTSKMSRKELWQHAIRSQIERKRAQMMSAYNSGELGQAAKHQVTLASLERQKSLGDQREQEEIAAEKAEAAAEVAAEAATAVVAAAAAPAAGAAAAPAAAPAKAAPEGSATKATDAASKVKWSESATGATNYSTSTPAGAEAGSQPADGAGKEYRMDSSDGLAYPLHAFIDEYGGNFEHPPAQWRNALTEQDFVRSMQTNSPAPTPEMIRAKEEAKTEEWLSSMQLGTAESAKVKLIVSGELRHLADNKEDMATIEAVFAACDADGDGEIDYEEMVGRYGKQAGHLLKEFDLDSGGTISKEEFIAVVDAKYAANPERTAKWVSFLAAPPRGKPKKVRAKEEAKKGKPKHLRVETGESSPSKAIQKVKAWESPPAKSTVRVQDAPKEPANSPAKPSTKSPSARSGTSPAGKSPTRSSSQAAAHRQHSIRPPRSPSSAAAAGDARSETVSLSPSVESMNRTDLKQQHASDDEGGAGEQNNCGRFAAAEWSASGIGPAMLDMGLDADGMSVVSAVSGGTYRRVKALSAQIRCMHFAFDAMCGARVRAVCCLRTTNSCAVVLPR